MEINLTRIIFVTFAEVKLLPYNEGFIADTPGFSSLELNIYKDDQLIQTIVVTTNKYDLTSFIKELY